MLSHLPSRATQSIPQQVWLLGLVSFFNDIASEMLYPVLPIFLTQVLGAPVATVGLIEGIAEGVASVFKGVFGRVSDRVGRRKPFVVVGYASSAVSKVIIALSTTWPVVLLGRVTDRFGKGLRTGARDAMLLDAATEANRGLIFGLHRSMDSAGGVLGPLAAWFLIESGYKIRFILWIAAVPALASILLFLFVREARRTPQAGIRLFRWSLGDFSREFRWLLVAIAIFSLGNSSDAFLILRARSVGMSVGQVILAYVVYNVVYTLLSAAAGRVSDVVGPKRVMILGVLIFAGVYLGFALDTQAVFIWPLFAIYGSYIALTDGVTKALAGRFITREQSAAAYGLMPLVMGLGALVASVVGGVLWSSVSPAATFLFGAGCAALSVPLFVGLPSQSPNR